MIVNILTALYTPFRFAIILLILVMFFIMNADEGGYKELYKKWIARFKNEKTYRVKFVFAFYTVMIL